MRSHGLRLPWITPRDWQQLTVRERENLLLMIPMMEAGVAEVRAAAATMGNPRPTADAGVQATHYDESFTVEALRATCRRLGLRSTDSKGVLLCRLNHMTEPL